MGLISRGDGPLDSRDRAAEEVKWQETRNADAKEEVSMHQHQNAEADAT